MSTAKRAHTGVAPASTVLLGGLLSLVGLSWDMQWHTDVGPDTFFTLPHLFIYAGAAVTGLASLTVVLVTTANRRAGRPVDPRVGGRVVNVFGRTFAAPLGYLVSGTGAAVFLLYGLWDQWWHGLYGFDAVIDSPPHIGLLLSTTVAAIGTVAVFAAAREHRWGRLGLLASLVLMMGNGPVLALGLQQLPVTAVDPVWVATAALEVMLLAVAAGFRRRPGGAATVALALAVVQAVFWWFSLWAAHWYASLVGLPMRDYTTGIPDLPSLLPMALLPVAAVLEVLFIVSARRGWHPGRVSVAVGGIGGLLLGMSLPLQNAMLFSGYKVGLSTVLGTGIAAGVVGLLGGFAGWRFGGMLRLLAPAASDASEAAGA